MFSVATNLFILAVYFLILIVELIFFKFFGVGYNTPWLMTTLIYIMFIIYQVLARTNEYLEKSKVKQILFSILDTVNGIPLINKEDKIIIRWDVIFKKLIDNREYILYDNIIKIKTKTIDRYVNQYPSLLFDSSLDMIERNDGIDTNSLVAGRGDKSKEEIKELDLSEDMKKKLYIKYLNSNKATFANYDSSIYIDVILNDEYEPPEYEKLGIMPDARYDGFSVVAFHKDQKHIIVPRKMVFVKKIDKEKWFYRNIDKLMKCAESIAAGTFEYGIVVDDYSLSDMLSDYIEDESGKIPALHFVSIEDNFLIFSDSVNGKERAKAYCSMETTHNGFEIKLVKYELVVDDTREIIDEEKTIAIGSAYQPLVTIMEKMPIITNNIRMAISKKDVENLVIK